MLMPTLTTFIAAMLVVALSYELSVSVPANGSEQNRPTVKTSNPDEDNDGLNDSFEQTMAERFAPIVFHDPKEPNFPTNVRLFLPATELWFYDSRCKQSSVKIAAPLVDSIPEKVQPPCDPRETLVDSYGTRSKNKDQSFFLKTVDEAKRAGGDPPDWTTYYHLYPNEDGGITIQYWRFYAYNTGEFLGHQVAVGSHGGDWEAIHVVLDFTNAPKVVRFLGHRSISTRPWSSLVSEGTHVLIKSEKGGHTSVPVKEKDKKEVARLIRQETWTGGRVSWPISVAQNSNRVAANSPVLMNLGEKLSPAAGMEFLQYSGLWGTRETGWWFPRLRSGYWGPAFNETGMGRDQFIAAWCEGIAKSLRERTSDDKAGRLSECYPTNVSR
jgi:hypothetical protein